MGGQLRINAYRTGEGRLAPERSDSFTMGDAIHAYASNDLMSYAQAPFCRWTPPKTERHTSGMIGRPSRTPADRETMRLVGLRLRWAREAQGLNQAEFAELAELHQTAISLYETGKRIPDQLALPRLCGRLRIDPDYLLEGSLQGVDRELAIRLAAAHPELAPPIDTAPRTDSNPASGKPRKRPA